jgi:hypothetical protein
VPRWKTKTSRLNTCYQRKDGGTSRLANLALAHKKCNELAADLPVVEKVLLRERLRAERTAAPPDRAA